MLKCPFSYSRDKAYVAEHHLFNYNYMANASECVESATCALWDEKEHCCGIMSILHELRNSNLHKNNS